MSSMHYSVLGLADKEQLQQLIHNNQESLQAQQDHQQSSDQHSMMPQHRHVQVLQVQDTADDPMQVQAALEDDAAELTASNWAQHLSSQHSSHSMHHSSGILFAPLSHSYYTPSSGSTNSGSSGSSKHLGFFQVKQREFPADPLVASTARPRTAGPVPGSPQGTTPEPPSADAAQPRTAAGQADQQQQQWLQFQQHAPDAAARTATFTRSLSSPEAALRLLPDLLQQPEALPAFSTSGKQHAADVSSSRSRQMPAAAQGSAGPIPGASTSHRQAVARLSLDGGGVSGVSRRSSGLMMQSAYPEWQDCAPAADDSGQMRRSSAAHSVPLPDSMVCSLQEAMLLLRKNQHQQQQMDVQSHRLVQAQQELMQRPASTPPFVSAVQQQQQEQEQQQLQSRPRSSYLPVPTHVQAVATALQHGQLSATGMDFGDQRPRSPAPAGSFSSQRRHSSLSPAGPMGAAAAAAMLSPEASAAAAAAASSIQQAMAAVNEEMEQLQLLQMLNKERRRLQAVARVAVARAAAAAAADSPAAGGLIGTVEARGRQGSWESSAGSHVGNSSSTHSNSGGFSSGSLGAEAQAVTGYLGAAVQLGPIAAQQQQQQQQQLLQQQLLQQQYQTEGGYGLTSGHGYGAASVQAAVAGGMARPFVSPQRPQRYSETGTGGSSSGPRAWDSSLAAVTAAMQRSGSLSPKAMWGEGVPNGPSAADFAARAAARPGHIRSSTWSDLPVPDYQLQHPQQQQQQQQQQQGYGSHQAQYADGRSWVGAGDYAQSSRHGLGARSLQGDVQGELQQLATDASHLQQLQQALQLLKRL